MFPMPTPQMPPFGPSSSLMGQGMLQGGLGQLSNLPLQQGVTGQSAGLLSKLLGGAQAGGGGLTNIVSMLQNAQKAIGFFQQVTPMVQQYYPLVKSLPALISTMKNSSNSDVETNTDATDSLVNEPEEKPNPPKKKKKKKHSSESNVTETRKKASKGKKANQPKKTAKKQRAEITKGIPAPKLYI